MASNEAAKSNPKLRPFGALVGTWTTVGSHPMVPSTVFHGRATFGWLEGGAFLVMHTEIDEPQVPSGIAIVGTDDSTGECTMLYFDERGVSRRYETSMEGRVWRFWRDATDFSQRFSAEISPDGATMVSRGEMSRDGKPWEADLALTYTRVRSV